MPYDKSKKGELFDEICERVSHGEPLRQICRNDHMPNFSTVYQWLDEDESFDQRFAHARKLGHDAIAQECLDIADNGENDWMDREMESGRIARVVDQECIQRSKLRVDTRLKLLAKWDRRYADRIGVEGTDGPPINVDQKTETLAAKVFAILQAARHRKAGEDLV